MASRNMSLTRAIFHVGAGKCGSSSLQRALSENPIFESISGQRYEYISVSAREIKRADAIVQTTKDSAFGSTSSVNLKLIDERPELRKQIRQVIADVNRSGAIPIFSSEGWMGQRNLFHETGFLTELGGGIEILMYVRPQVAWLNSAWWQWGAWTNEPFSRWHARPLKNLDWHQKLDDWSSAAGVAKASARLATTNVVDDFYGYIGAEKPATKRGNASLDATILRLYQRHRALRPGPHDSRIDFVLEAYVERSRSNKVPWIISRDDAQRFIDIFRASNQNLAERLPPDLKRNMESDAAWWDASVYPIDRVEDPAVPEGPISDYEQLSADLVGAILKLEGEVRTLRASLRKARSRSGKRVAERAVHDEPPRGTRRSRSSWLGALLRMLTRTPQR